MPGFRGKKLCFVTAALVLTADLWTKQAAFAALQPGLTHWVWDGTWGEWLGFQRVENTGIMWGWLPDLGDLLRWVRMGAALVVLGLLRSTPPAARAVILALGLVLGGALGNIYDGFAHGSVRDFIKVDLDLPLFDPFPVFNLADSAICVGVAVLAFGMGRRGRAAPDAPGSDRMAPTTRDPSP